MKRWWNSLAAASGVMCLMVVVLAFALDDRGPIYFGHRPQFMLSINLGGIALVKDGRWVFQMNTILLIALLGLIPAQWWFGRNREGRRRAKEGQHAFEVIGRDAPSPPPTATRADTMKP
jgi:hypothetical protein